MTLVELNRILLAVCPTGEITWTDNNEIVFKTRLTDDEAGNLTEVND